MPNSMISHGPSKAVSCHFSDLVQIHLGFAVRTTHATAPLVTEPAAKKKAGVATTKAAQTVAAPATPISPPIAKFDVPVTSSKSAGQSPSSKANAAKAKATVPAAAVKPSTPPSVAKVLADEAQLIAPVDDESAFKDAKLSPSLDTASGIAELVQELKDGTATCTYCG